MNARKTTIVQRAIALCRKPRLRLWEALIYTGQEKKDFKRQCKRAGLSKTPTGYYLREQLDAMMSGKALPATITTAPQAGIRRI